MAFDDVLQAGLEYRLIPNVPTISGKATHEGFRSAYYSRACVSIHAAAAVVTVAHPASGGHHGV